MQARLPRSSLAEEPRFKELAGSFRPSRRILNFVDLNKLVDIYGSLLPRFISQETFNKLPGGGGVPGAFVPRRLGRFTRL